MVLFCNTLKTCGVTSIVALIPQNSWIMRIPFPGPLNRIASHDKHFTASSHSLGLSAHISVFIRSKSSIV